MPDVILGPLQPDSVAAAVHALVAMGAQRRPDLAGRLVGDVVLRFTEDYPAVRIALKGDVIEVSDDDDTARPRRHDVTIRGRIGDVNALIACPLSGGIPKPTTTDGRAALARLADRRVRVDGPLNLARQLLMLLSVSRERARPPS